MISSPFDGGGARVGVDRIKTFGSPLPFTLLDMFSNRRCSPRDALSNRVNPLPPGEGRENSQICPCRVLHIRITCEPSMREWMKILIAVEIHKISGKVLKRRKMSW